MADNESSILNQLDPKMKWWIMAIILQSLGSAAKMMIDNADTDTQHLCIVYLLGITIGLVTDTFMAAVGRLFNKMQIILKLEYLEMR